MQGMQKVSGIRVWEEEGENKGKTPLNAVPERLTILLTQQSVMMRAVPLALAAPVKSPVASSVTSATIYHRLDSLGGKSTFVTIVTTVTISSVVIMLVNFCI